MSNPVKKAGQKSRHLYNLFIIAVSLLQVEYSWTPHHNEYECLAQADFYDEVLGVHSIRTTHMSRITDKSTKSVGGTTKWKPNYILHMKVWNLTILHVRENTFFYISGHNIFKSAEKTKWNHIYTNCNTWVSYERWAKKNGSWGMTILRCNNFPFVQISVLVYLNLIKILENENTSKKSNSN